MAGIITGVCPLHPDIAFQINVDRLSFESTEPNLQCLRGGPVCSSANGRSRAAAIGHPRDGHIRTLTNKSGKK